MGCNASTSGAISRPTELSEECKLDESHVFSFSNILKELKATPSLTVNKTEYGLLHTGGFVRLATDVCRIYYLAQNTTEHTSPDWKFHVSVSPKDLPLAWDIIAKIFIESGCNSGMKMCLNSVDDPFGHWTEGQFGREITIYIYKHSKYYASVIVDDPKLQLNPKLEHTNKFWRTFVDKINTSLSHYNITANGLADGDRAVNKYVSIRNEAYVKVNGHLEYPPNSYGWNAAGHKCPIKLDKMDKIEETRQQNELVKVSEETEDLSQI